LSKIKDSPIKELHNNIAGVVVHGEKNEVDKLKPCSIEKEDRLGMSS
jgi:hypothetical protein